VIRPFVYSHAQSGEDAALFVMRGEIETFSQIRVSNTIIQDVQALYWVRERLQCVKGFRLIEALAALPGTLTRTPFARSLRSSAKSRRPLVLPFLILMQEAA
jgi:hypothetical protein